MAWIVYIILCSDGSLYTGITNDLERRIKQHNEGKGAKYTRGRGPVKVMKTFEFETKSEAAKEEYRIKQLNKQQKIALWKDK